MKTTKLIIALGLLAGAAQAATITVSAGLTSTGVTPFVNGLVVTNFFTGVGTWNAATSAFTPFGVAADTGEVSVAITATGPSSFNSALIAVFVGTGDSIANSGTSWAVFTSTAGTTFPPDVSAATGVTFSMTTPAVLNIVGKGDPQGGFFTGGVNTNNYALAAIPEPSAALLGAIGALGLLRRRRI